MKPRIVLAVSGASGVAIAFRILDLLTEFGAETHLVISKPAERTLVEELDAAAPGRLRAAASECHSIDDIGARIASGSFSTQGMIVAPCSMRSLAAIAYSLSDNLLVRAADVHLKERRPLILLARETPLHLGHLRAMTTATEMGAIVMPPLPDFYLKLTTVEAIIDQIARRAVDLLHIFPPAARAWKDQRG